MKSIDWNMVIVIVTLFSAGCCAGMWWAERALRKERQELERGRIVVSMPMDPQKASQMMALLRELLADIEQTKGETQ